MSEWKEHRGSVQPPETKGCRVEIEDRIGKRFNLEADRVAWEIEGFSTDVFRYRLLDTPAAEEVDDGGPAFAGGDPVHGGHPGMAIRTYIATAVMSALISGRMADGNDYPDREITAANSVAYADALIAALAARKEK